MIGATGCSMPSQTKTEILSKPQVKIEERDEKGLDFNYQVNPETFEIKVESNGEEVLVSLPQTIRKVSELKEETDKISWEYPDEEVAVVVEKKGDYLDVAITSYKQGENSFTWPQVQGESYMMPLREGKYIPKDDPYWQAYLEEMEMNMMESLSMGFFGVNHETYGVLYIMDDLFHSEMNFQTKDQIGFEVEHTYTRITEDPTYSFRIYVTENDPVQLAKLYKAYQIEKGQFKTLADKAKENPNIEKLYGASHIYLWDQAVIAEEDIKWEALRNYDFEAFFRGKDKPAVERFMALIESIEEGKEAVKVLKDLQNQDYVDNYQKSIICKVMSKLLLQPQFYQEEIWTQKDREMEELLKQGKENLNQVQSIAVNKHALATNMPELFEPVDQWADSRGVEILEDMKASGIDKLWIGLDNWIQGLSKPELVKYAVEAGYLIGPYDSYHSIHEPGKEQWHTATFEDQTLFERATIINKKGEFEKGFQGVGRKLNPTLSLESVAKRVGNLMAMDVPFNAWFIDCDATGEIYDDYTEGHITTQEKDLQARLERMGYIRDEFNLVVGSEGGHDFAANTIALAHGIELPSFSWMDEDMKANKESEYYLGRWYSPKGGVPEKFSKPVPIKEDYKKIFLDPTYNLPLFKLVYNDAMITSYHWDWSTFKIQDEVGDRMLYEILYNVPPLYHLDQWEWEKYKEAIVEHSNFYEAFSEQVINQPMTDFEILSEDRLVQTTVYGETIRVVANFKDEVFVYGEDTLAPHSLIVDNGKEKIVYKR